MFSFKSRKKIFTDIYKKHRWGGAGDYYSGAGSYRADLLDGYVLFLQSFIKEKAIETIVDLGCGDFNVGSKYAGDVKKYIGIDIVKSLIERNNDKFGTDNIVFLCKDIVKDKLPDGDLCCVRQVLQHCTNKEIILILENLSNYRYILITENVYKKELTDNYNLDIKADRSTRRSQKSGVYLEESPFNINCTIVKKWDYNEHEDLVMYLLVNDV